MRTLEDIARYYYCDKLHSHSYINFYSSLLVDIKVRRLLEIGIGFPELMSPLVPKYVHGASLRMWADYLPDADIFACDIRPDTLINEGRIHSVVCDQYDTVALEGMAEQFTAGGLFDVIIDDGCHHTLAQVISFFTLWKYLAPGGVYVVEDVGYPDVLSKATGGEVHIFRKDGRWDDVLVTKEK